MNTDRINLLNTFIDQEPDNPFNRYALAMEFYEVQPEKALELLRYLADHHSDYLPTFYKLSHLLWEEEELELAERYFLKGIALAKDQGDAKALKELEAAYQNFQFEIE